MPVTPGASREGCVAVGYSRMLLDKRKGEIAELGISKSVVALRVISSFGALRDLMSAGNIKEPVLFASILPASTQLFILSKDGIEDIGPVEHGYASMLMQIMTTLNLKFEGSAARLFFGNIYDFDDIGDALASPLIAKIKARLESHKGAKPASLVISGLPPARTRLISKHISKELGLPSVEMPLEVTALEGAGLPELPAVGAPSLVHMFKAIGIANGGPAPFFFDLNQTPADVSIYWTATPAHPHVIKMYRGIAVDENGNPIDTKTAKEEIKHAAHQAEVVKIGDPVSSGATKERKIVRYYRGTPIYEDDTDSEAHPAAAAPAKPAAEPKPTPEEEANTEVRVYRGITFRVPKH
jgi:hypothetical protein